ncbi:MAG TPA: hypothetical protein VI913_04840 [Candidatus Peribacteraceae bacterium]|nr:hypothetical protein [Candidatus Peribacteraceae bacterium]
MRLFALQTDKNQVVERFCHGGESIVRLTHYHWMMFAVGIIQEILVTIGLGILAGMAVFLGMPWGYAAGAFVVTWFAFCFFGILKAYLDWCYDFILITTDKVILVDQTSIFRQTIKPIHLENIGAAGTSTQWWNMFDFGILVLDLKEGEGGGTITKRFVPHARDVAGAISDALTRYQRGGATNARERAGAQAEVGRRNLRHATDEVPAAVSG